jgi:hypothetical protein
MPELARRLLQGLVRWALLSKRISQKLASLASNRTARSKGKRERKPNLIIKLMILMVLENRLRRNRIPLAQRVQGIDDPAGGIGNDVGLAVLGGGGAEDFIGFEDLGDADI